MGRDGDFYLVGHFEAGAAFPVALGHEDAHEIAEPALLVGREKGIVLDIAIEHSRPGVGKRLGEQSPPTPVAQPIEDHAARRLKGICKQRALILARPATTVNRTREPDPIRAQPAHFPMTEAVSPPVEYFHYFHYFHARLAAC